MKFTARIEVTKGMDGQSDVAGQDAYGEVGIRYPSTSSPARRTALEWVARRESAQLKGLSHTIAEVAEVRQPVDRVEGWARRSVSTRSTT